MVWDDPFHSQDHPPISLNSSQVSVSHPLHKNHDPIQGEDRIIASSSAISSQGSAFFRVGSKRALDGNSIPSSKF